MRRLTAIYGLVCVLALGGWGHVWARAACAHALATPAAATPEQHDCCHAQVAQPTEHCAAATHQTHDAAEHTQTFAQAPRGACCRADSAQVEPVNETLSQSDPACTHCALRSAPAPSVGVAGAPQAAKRADACAPLPVRRVHGSAIVRVSPGTPQQHAPPGRTRCHLLSILLI